MSGVLQSRQAVMRGMLALAIVAAAVFAAGFRPEGAAAQTAAISAGGPYQTYAGRTVQLSGTIVTGTAAAATWNFSDGTSLAGLTVVKTFWVPGTYTATLTVVDQFGFTSAATTTVTVFPISALTGILTPAALLSGVPFWVPVNLDVRLGTAVGPLCNRILPEGVAPINASAESTTPLACRAFE